jgi:hypothetical protein
MIVAFGVVVSAGQSGTEKVSERSRANSVPYRAPRTAWGDPDLQGIFSNAFEANTPLERPQQFDGRRLEDVTGAELLEIKKAAHERALIGVSGGLHAPDHFWQEYYELEKGAQAWLITDPPDGKLPPLTADGRRRSTARAEARRNSGRGPADGPEDRSLYDRCVTRGVPGSMMPAYYGNNYEIQQGPGYVVIRYEMVHESRVIPLDNRPHVGASIRMYMGDPRGHWDGDTLVVETTNFTDRTPFQGSSEKLTLTERFTRTSPNRVRWSVTFDDPATWTRPWTFSMPLTIDPTQRVFEYGCHEGNYAMFHILSAGRSDDKRTEDLAKRGIMLARPPIPTEAEGEER